ncbi:MAG TPA: EAL domain-containing protein [Alphaproteobacteria bacterium]|nr:EAL domain-containing protein [Alphaproteobacteria bacterium]
MISALPLWFWFAAAAVMVVALCIAQGWRLSRHWVEKAVAERTKGLEGVSRRFRLMVDQAFDLMAVTDGTGNVEYVNRAWSRLLGYAPEEMKERQLGEVIHQNDREAFQRLLDRALRGEPAEETVLRCRMPDGSWLYVEAVAHGLPDTDWLIRHAVVHARDITARRRAADELARSEQRFRDFAGSSADWLWEVDTQQNFTYVSPGVANVLGFEPDEMTGRVQLMTLFDDPADSIRDLIMSRVERQQPYRDLEFWTRARNGDKVCLRMSGVPVFDEFQQLVGYRGVASNVTSSKLASDNMFRLATTDHLTGLLNRHRFKEELERAVTLSRRHHTSGVVVFIDLDRFKEINDTHGHEAGDQILVGLSNILRETVRSTDVVARLGGDEFAVIMHNIGVPAAGEKVQKMIERVNAFYVDYHGAKLTVTMSVGMVQYPVGDKGAEHLIMSADLAMYKAKDMGRNRLFVDAADANEESIGSVRAQLKWVDRLRVCLETGDFEMHYQPIVPVHKKARPMFEALLRIYDENGKVGSPALYIDAAEHFGLIQQLDLAVVRRVFETQLKLKKMGLAADVSINLSCRTLGDIAVMKKLKELMKELPVNPAHIMFEVTETMALHDPAQMRDIGDIHIFVTELRAMGFRFALDDFGTGFTSFRYLKVLDVDVVKIDGEYIKSILTDEDDKLFVASMVQLCKGLGIDTIAEFVENADIMTLLTDLGVGWGQGWHLGKPQPDLPKLIEAYQGKVAGDYPALAPAVSAAPAAVVVPANGKANGGNGQAAAVEKPVAPRSVVVRSKKAGGKAPVKGVRK